MYFLFQFVNNILKKPAKCFNFFECFRKEQSSLEKIQWGSIIGDETQIITNVSVARVHANINSFTFRVVMVYFCANLHKTIWQSIENSRNYKAFLAPLLSALYRVQSSLQTKIMEAGGRIKHSSKDLNENMCKLKEHIYSISDKKAIWPTKKSTTYSPRMRNIWLNKTNQEFVKVKNENNKYVFKKV